MIDRPEALAQLARLLGEDALREATVETAREAARTGHSRLAAGLLAEATGSDDVSDRQSALVYLEQRLQDLSELIDDAEREHLTATVREQIERW